MVRVLNTCHSALFLGNIFKGSIVCLLVDVRVLILMGVGVLWLVVENIRLKHALIASVHSLVVHVVKDICQSYIRLLMSCELI
jgi:hypothetical protein